MKQDIVLQVMNTENNGQGLNRACLHNIPGLPFRSALKGGAEQLSTLPQSDNPAEYPYLPREKSKGMPRKTCGQVRNTLRVFIIKPLILQLQRPTTVQSSHSLYHPELCSYSSQYSMTSAQKSMLVNT